MIAFILGAPILALHISAFFVNITFVVIADALALSWVLGKKEVLSIQVMRTLHRIVSVGLCVSVVTGAIMFWDVRDYLLTLPAFYTKMLFVLALVVNSFVIGKHMHIAVERPFKTLEPEEKRPLFISGAVSTIAWVGTFIAAKSLGF